MCEKPQLMLFPSFIGNKLCIRYINYTFVLLFSYVSFRMTYCYFVHFSLNPEQKDELVHVIEKLLSDKTTLVVGSAVMAFEEVNFQLLIISVFTPFSVAI